MVSLMRDKSIYFRLPKTEKKGFLLEHDYLPHFYDKLHYHPELQLKFVIEGTGDLFVGNTFTHFEPGNLFLIGPNQSHVFKSDPCYFDEENDLISHSISVFFQEESLGNGFFTIEEMADIQNLIERSGRGIQFAPSAIDKVENRILKLVDISGFEQFLEILSILNELATTD